MTTPKQSAQEFIDTISDKGGLIEALDQGMSIGNYDLPQDMIELWSEMVDTFGTLAEQMDDFSDAIDDHGLERK